MIAMVLLIGLVATWILPLRTRVIGFVAQGIAFLGTLVGVATIIVGIGPRTLPDIVYHMGILGVLASGLILAWPATSGSRGHGAAPQR